MRLRVQVRVILEDDYLAALHLPPPGPVRYKSEKRFPFVLSDPERWELGQLAFQIQEQYKLIYNRDLGGVKYFVDSKDDSLLPLHETVYDYLIDEGRARSDRNDQHAAVKVVQEQGRALRAGSVRPDFSNPRYRIPPPPSRPPVPGFYDPPLHLGKRSFLQELEPYNSAGAGPSSKRQRREDLDEIREEDDGLALSIERDITDHLEPNHSSRRAASIDLIEDSQSSGGRQPLDLPLHSHAQTNHPTVGEHSPSAAGNDASALRPDTNGVHPVSSAVALIPSSIEARPKTTRTSKARTSSKYHSPEAGLRSDSARQSSAGQLFPVPRATLSDPIHLDVHKRFTSKQQKDEVYALITTPSDVSRNFSGSGPKRELPHDSKWQSSPTRGSFSGAKRFKPASKSVYDLFESEIDDSQQSQGSKAQKMTVGKLDSRSQDGLEGAVGSREVIALMDGGAIILDKSSKRPRNAIGCDMYPHLTDAEDVRSGHGDTAMAVDEDAPANQSNDDFETPPADAAAMEKRRKPSFQKSLATAVSELQPPGHSKLGMMIPPRQSTSTDDPTVKTTVRESNAIIRTPCKANLAQISGRIAKVEGELQGHDTAPIEASPSTASQSGKKDARKNRRRESRKRKAGVNGDDPSPSQPSELLRTDLQLIADRQPSPTSAQIRPPVTVKIPRSRKAAMKETPIDSPSEQLLDMEAFAQNTGQAQTLPKMSELPKGRKPLANRKTSASFNPSASDQTVPPQKAKAASKSKQNPRTVKADIGNASPIQVSVVDILNGTEGALQPDISKDGKSEQQTEGRMGLGITNSPRKEKRTSSISEGQPLVAVKSQKVKRNNAVKEAATSDHGKKNSKFVGKLQSAVAAEESKTSKKLQLQEQDSAEVQDVNEDSPHVQAIANMPVSSTSRGKAGAGKRPTKGSTSIEPASLPATASKPEGSDYVPIPPGMTAEEYHARVKSLESTLRQAKEQKKYQKHPTWDEIQAKANAGSEASSNHSEFNAAHSGTKSKEDPSNDDMLSEEKGAPAKRVSQVKTPASSIRNASLPVTQETTKKPKAITNVKPKTPSSIASSENAKPFRSPSTPVTRQAPATTAKPESNAVARTSSMAALPKSIFKRPTLQDMKQQVSQSSSVSLGNPLAVRQTAVTPKAPPRVQQIEDDDDSTESATESEDEKFQEKAKALFATPKPDPAIRDASNSEEEDDDEDSE